MISSSTATTTAEQPPTRAPIESNRKALTLHRRVHTQPRCPAPGLTRLVSVRARSFATRRRCHRSSGACPLPSTRRCLPKSRRSPSRASPVRVPSSPAPRLCRCAHGSVRCANISYKLKGTVQASGRLSSRLYMLTASFPRSAVRSTNNPRLVCVSPQGHRSGSASAALRCGGGGDV